MNYEMRKQIPERKRKSARRLVESCNDAITQRKAFSKALSNCSDFFNKQRPEGFEISIGNLRNFKFVNFIK